MGILILLYLKNVDIERFVLMKCCMTTNYERVEGEKSPIPNHKSPIIALPRPFSPNRNGKTLKPNHISIPTIDSPYAHTRLATRKQFEVCSENRTGREDHVISGNPHETTTLSKIKKCPTKMKTIRGLAEA